MLYVKRIIAHLIDVGIIFFVLILAVGLLGNSPWVGVLILIPPPYFIFKDLLFRNASFGKKIMGLEILKRDGKGKASVKQIIMRNAYNTRDSGCTWFESDWGVFFETKTERGNDIKFNTRVAETRKH